MKKALITGIAGQDGFYVEEKGFQEEAFPLIILPDGKGSGGKDVLQK